MSDMNGWLSGCGLQEMVRVGATSKCSLLTGPGTERGFRKAGFLSLLSSPRRIVLLCFLIGAMGTVIHRDAVKGHGGTKGYAASSPAA